MTEKLYYLDSHLIQFDAEVIDCVEIKNGYGIVLSRTAFFPEGGGQQGDSGYINDVRVTDTHEKNGLIFHYTDVPLELGSKVFGKIDWDIRFARMQMHSGEHVVSGLINKHFGLNNVGFHMSETQVTIDFDGELDANQLSFIENLANAAVYENVNVTARFPEPSELIEMDYRSKLDLTENVRIVTFDGYDVCACCAPHVSKTGEIGIIKLLDFMRHRGGVRINMTCGINAFNDYKMRYESTVAISNELSAKQNAITEAVCKLKSDLHDIKGENAALSKKLVAFIADNIETNDNENICIFQSGLTADDMRELVNHIVNKTTKVCAVFSGDDVSGYKYVIGASNYDLRASAKNINSAISGRGGGSAEMIQGSASANKSTIEKFIMSL